MGIIRWVAEHCDVCPETYADQPRRAREIGRAFLGELFDRVESAPVPASERLRLCRPCAHELVELIADGAYQALSVVAGDHANAD